MDPTGAVHWTSPYRARTIVTQPAFRMTTPDLDEEPARPRIHIPEVLPDEPPF